jgi:hypothetical protein
VAARFRAGSRPVSAAVRCMPAMVSATRAAAVGTAAGDPVGGAGGQAGQIVPVATEAHLGALGPLRSPR